MTIELSEGLDKLVYVGHCSVPSFAADCDVLSDQPHSENRTSSLAWDESMLVSHLGQK